MQTIVELNEYLRRAQKLLRPEDRIDIVSYLAFHPKSGESCCGPLVAFGSFGGAVKGWGKAVESESYTIITTR